MTSLRSAHTFHIPVMGTAFTIDAPLKVGRYGISSVVSLVDDTLTEQMRKYYSDKEGLPFTPIGKDEDDYRARRITAYLDLLGELLARQSASLQASDFAPGSEITRYYDLLPECPLKDEYRAMLAETDPDRRRSQEEALRPKAVPGAIDVNIMTKVDRDVYVDGVKLDPKYSDAMAALRGFATSRVSSSIVLSAGLNMRLYSYMSEFEDFFPDGRGEFRKRVILKVSDYRSAQIQGKFLAKRGIWVSEYRIESGLNCGGHAFATTGYLMGPIMDELRLRRGELREQTFKTLAPALKAMGRPVPSAPPPMRITAQGGIGTAEENEMMFRYYQVDGTGWGTPFLLVPEATTLDDEHVLKLLDAREGDVYLSNSSPFGIPFWNLRTSGSEDFRRQHIAEGSPGSICTKGSVKLNTEFTRTPICTASKAYIKLKLDSLMGRGLDAVRLEREREGTLAKSCLCHDLAGGATKKYGIDPQAHSAICSGPNIMNFSRLATLDEMVGHIYGRLNLMTNPDRPHMFITELKLYVKYLSDELETYSLALSARTPKYFEEFRANLLEGIEHYKQTAGEIIGEHKERFLADLKQMQEQIEEMPALKAMMASEA